MRALRNPLFGFTTAELEATPLRTGYVVRPRGACGTAGWRPRPWRAIYIGKIARSPAHAVALALAS